MRQLAIILTLCIGIAATATIKKGTKVSQICYDWLGSEICFTNAPPFHNALGFLPEPPELVAPTFFLFHRNARNGLPIRQERTNLTSSGFVGKKETKFLSHGYLGACTDWPPQFAQALLKQGDFNVVCIDWSRGANVSYSQCIANSRLAATVAFHLIRYLVYELGADLDRIHLIGHSLGSHLSGYIGQLFEGRIGRISGLDPAGPNYDGQSPVVRLDPGDAKFVDVVHTDARASLLQLGFGLLMPLGHVDFYVNGGSSQAGCPVLHLQSLITALQESVLEIRPHDPKSIIWPCTMTWALASSLLVAREKANVIAHLKWTC